MVSWSFEGSVASLEKKAAIPAEEVRELWLFLRVRKGLSPF
ncbi:MAG: hypothetical protein V4494_07520 [Chlamydiota bacterium]